MAQPAVAADLHQPLDVLRHLAAKVAFDLQLAVDVLTEADDLLLGEVADTRVGLMPVSRSTFWLVVRPMPKM